MRKLLQTVGLLLVLGLQPALAAEENIMRDCLEGETPEVRIRGCTAYLYLDFTSELAGWAYNARGMAYLEQGQYDHAFWDLEEAVGRAPGEAAIHLNHAVILVNFLEKEGTLDFEDTLTYQDVITSVDKAFAIPPLAGEEMNPHGIVVGRSAKGRAYFGLKEYSKAIAEFTGALDASDVEDKESQPALYKLRAKAYDANGEIEKAAADRAKAKSAN